MTTIVSALTGFLRKYAGEAESVGTALNALLAALPINAADRANIQAHIDTITGAPESIAAWLENNLDLTVGDLGGEIAIDGDQLDKAVEAYFAAHPFTPPPVKIDKADIDKAVAAYLSSDKGKAVIAAAMPKAAPAAKAAK